jgi:hypothetical protein
MIIITAPVTPIAASSTETKVSSLPLSFKKEGVVERHQIEGNDPSDRSFNRSIQVSRAVQAYQAKVMYEALTVEGHPHPTIAGAVRSVVEKLQKLGFTRMRTRPNFRGKRYLAEKETWVDYPDSS